MASCDNRINCHIQITLRSLFTTEKWAPQKRVCKPYKSEAEVQVVQVNKMTGLQNIRSRRALQGQDKQSVVFPWCFDAWGTGGRCRTQLAGGQALLSATHSVTHSAGAINVSKKKKKSRWDAQLEGVWVSEVQISRSQRWGLPRASPHSYKCFNVLFRDTHSRLLSSKCRKQRAEFNQSCL